MSVFGAYGSYSQGDDWLIAILALVLVYIVFSPLYIIYLRNRHSRRIKGHLVTTAYKLPVDLTPTELSYIFSARVGKNQLYATMLDLANRSVVILDKEEDDIKVSIGPKEDSNLRDAEKLLLDQVHDANKPLAIGKIIQGNAEYEIKEGKKITGSKSYVFWWLQRESLRRRRIIEKRMSSTYFMMLFKFGFLGGLIVSLLPLFLIRFVQMLQSGEIEIDSLVKNIQSGVLLWLIVLVPLLVFCFFLLRFRGRMLGRVWLLTSGFQRYLGQMDAFREYVRLSHKGKLRFESKELEKESIARTRPYAIACGYIKP